MGSTARAIKFAASSGTSGGALRASVRRVMSAALLLTLPSCLVAQDTIPDRYQRLEQMHHTAFTARDGVVGIPHKVAQTADGFLWVGTSNGLLRYDGVRFEAYQPEEGELPAVAVSALTAAPEGGLWVGHSRGGVTFISPAGRATHYSTLEGVPVGTVRSIAVDHDGGVWLAAVGGLARLEGERWQIVRETWNFPNKSAWSLFVERDGTLWVGGATPDRIRFLPKGSRKFVDTGLSTPALVFAQLRDSVVAFPHVVEERMYIARRHADTATEVQEIPGVPSLDIAMDGEGGLWVAEFGAARYRLTTSDSGRFLRGAVERYASSDGMTGRVAEAVFIDREGSAWLATDGGLDRFRRRRLTWLSDTVVRLGGSLVADRDGEVWVMSMQSPSIRRARDLMAVLDAPPRADDAFPDRDGNLWFSTAPGLVRWSGKQFTTIPPPAEVSRVNGKYSVLAGTSDSTGAVWASIGGFGTFRWKDSAWTFKKILPNRPDLSPIAMHSDAEGVWLAYRDEIAMVRGDSVRIYSKRDGLNIGALLSLRTDRGQVWVGGEQGFARRDGERFRTVEAAEGQQFASVTGIVPARDGLWLASSIGIVHIPVVELERLAPNSAYRVHLELLAVESELPDAIKSLNLSRSFQPAAGGADGVVWFVTMHGIARVDPRLIGRNRLPPPVVIRSVVADDSAYSTRGLTLPPLTRTLRIGYSGLSLVDPAQVQFRYRLDGWEDRWHDAGSRREASYTDLRPGRYTFRVTASNNDGVWNETGAALPFTVRPAWYQTLLFKLLAVGAFLTLALALYQYRLRRVSAMLSARFDARLEERTRIARELHDTLLQTVQGSRMAADDALQRPEDTVQMRRALERLSTWMSQAAQEGRAALNSLRGATPPASDLAHALRHAASTVAPAGLAVSVSVRGTPRALHPVVHDEVTRIGSEAIRNSSAHARASTLEVLVEYGPDLILRITDNGIGIDPAIAGNGKRGHYGLRGMQERATGVGATLNVAPASPGTQVTLVVPGRTAFQRPLYSPNGELP